MATRFHLTPEGPKACTVDPTNPKSRGCKYGDHYDNKETAETAHQEKLALEFGATSTITKKLSQAELGELAANPNSTKEDFMKVAELGGIRAINKLANNPNASTEALGVAYDRKIKGTDYNLTNNINFPYEDYPELLGHRKAYESVLRRGALNDTVAQLFIDHGVSPGSILASGAPGISKDFFNELVSEVREGYPGVPNAALSDERLDYKKFYPKWEETTLNNAAYVESNPDRLAAMYEEYEKRGEVNQHTASRLLSNKNFPVEKYNEAVVNPLFNKGLSGVAMIKNTRLTQDQKEILKNNSESARRYAKVKELSDSGAIDSVFEGGGSRDGSRRSYNLNPNKVRELGLDSKNIDTYFREVKGNWLWDAYYDPSTGVYSGYID